MEIKTSGSDIYSETRSIYILKIMSFFVIIVKVWDAHLYGNSKPTEDTEWPGPEKWQMSIN